MNPAFVAAFVVMFSTALLLPALYRMRHGSDRNPLHRRRNWRD